MKKHTKFILFAVGVSTATIYAFNKFVESTATQKNLLSTEHGEFYSWTNGNIFYSKTGEGSPILLLHDANASASSVEWTKLVRRLEKKHTVYCLDLLGCGRSDKPAIEYTNYLYVQMITAFVKDVIGQKTTVAASNLSASFVTMANHMDDTLFDKMILINPVSLKQLDIIPDDLSKWKKHMVELPFIGTFIYNMMTTPKQIDYEFRTRYFERPQFISSNLEEVYYESAHTNGSNGKYLYSSMLGNYLNNGISHAVRSLSTPTLIIGSKELKHNMHTLDDYHKVNPKIEIIRINNGNLYPHMEVPEKIASVIEDYIY